VDAVAASFVGDDRVIVVTVMAIDVVDAAVVNDTVSGSGAGSGA